MSTVAAILLAAGSSKRFGLANKLLTEVDGEPLVRRVARALAASRAAPVLVVTGHEAAAVAAAIEGLGCVVVHNPAHAEGMGSSVAAGIRALGEIAPNAAGALIGLGDMPEIDRSLFDRLIEAFLADGGRRITFPVDGEGRQRNPVVWPRDHCPALARLTGDKGGRDLIASAGARCQGVAVDGDATSLDIDTPEALATWRAGKSIDAGRSKPRASDRAEKGDP